MWNQSISKILEDCTFSKIPESYMLPSSLQERMLKLKENSYKNLNTVTMSMPTCKDSLWEIIAILKPHSTLFRCHLYSWIPLNNSSSIFFIKWEFQLFNFDSSLKMLHFWIFYCPYEIDGCIFVLWCGRLLNLIGINESPKAFAFLSRHEPWIMVYRLLIY